MKIDKRFYIASPKMIPGTALHEAWAKATIEEAVELATKQCRDREEMQMVVQIVKIIYSEPKPIVIEDVE